MSKPKRSWFRMGAGFVMATTAFSLANLAGGNVALVPDLTATLGVTIYPTIIVTYFFLGTVLAGIAAWIGAKTDRDLPAAVEAVYGCRGKKILAAAILGVCLPASSLTGGYFAGTVIEQLTGWPHWLSAWLCLAFFTALAMGQWRSVVTVSNRVALAVLPVIACLAYHAYQAAGGLPTVTDWRPGAVKPTLALALAGYSVGGMRPALLAEAGMYMKAPRTAVVLSVMAKILEGVFTLLVAYTVLASGSSGTLTLAAAARDLWGDWGWVLLEVLLFSVFLNSMAPAMMVNAHQLKELLPVDYERAMIIAFALVAAGMSLSFTAIFCLLAGTGIFMAVMMVATALRLINRRPASESRLETVPLPSEPT